MFASYRHIARNVFHCLFQVSLARSAPSKGDGQGEGLLFTSYDRTLVVKQITSEDVADVHNILSEYHQVTTVTVVLNISCVESV